MGSVPNTGLVMVTTALGESVWAPPPSATVPAGHDTTRLLALPGPTCQPVVTGEVTDAAATRPSVATTAADKPAATKPAHSTAKARDRPAAPCISAPPAPRASASARAE